MRLVVHALLSAHAFSGADWCLQSDALPDSRRQGQNPEGIDLLKLDCGGKQGQSVIGPSSSTVSLRVFLDKSSIEAYAAGGRGVASHRVYPTAEQLKAGIQLVNQGTNDVTISGT